MAAKANSLVVLLAVLLLAIPFAACAPTSHAAMASMHCAECCPANATPTPAACCATRSQADLPQSPTLQAAPLTQAGVDWLALAQPSLVRFAARPQSAPPPPHHTILRI